MKNVLVLGLLVLTSQSYAAEYLELNCNISNSVMNSMYRPIKLKSGMIETIDCQKFLTCRKSIYEISMNYNNTYEYVTVLVRDTETKKEFSTEHTLKPSEVGQQPAEFNIGYGDVVTDMNDVIDLDSKGRFLKISCERTNNLYTLDSAGAK